MSTRKQALLDHLVHSLVRLALALKTACAQQLTGKNLLVAGMDFDARWVNQVMDVQQATTWSQESSSFLKGMHHALVFNSSKRPGKQPDIKTR